MSWSLVLHGGAGSIERHRLTPEQDAGARAGLSRALDAGAAILSDGGSALDAVAAAVQVLEDDPHFNAGRGAAFTRDGGIELDAAIMDGATRAAGAVAGSRRRAPRRARTPGDGGEPHVLLSGTGAEQFARDQGLEVAPEGWFETPERRRQLDEMLSRNADAFDVDMKYGTVGAVARDGGPCRRRHLDRRRDGQALGPDRRFAADRRGHLRRRSCLRGIVYRIGRILHPRRRGA